MIRVYIGFDPSETVAFHVLSHSIMCHASVPVAVTPLKLSQLPMWREPEGSTEFAFSRFLVPFLCNYEGRAIFMDCDILCRADILGLWSEIPNDQAVAVVKHDYTPKNERKFLNHEQQAYARKNWSSVMVFNNAMCRVLTPEYVNTAPGLELHQFRWLDDELIWKLHPSWNHLVGEYPENPEAKLVHFTLGTPCFKKYRFCEFSQEWFTERERMLFHETRNEYSRPIRVEA